MTQYMILSSDNASALAAKVRALIKEGWRVKGGVAYDTNRKEFLQAMVKN
jgi:hypothetical protein